MKKLSKQQVKAVKWDISLTIFLFILSVVFFAVSIYLFELPWLAGFFLFYMGYCVGHVILLLKLKHGTYF